MHRFPGKLNQFNIMMKKLYEKLYQLLKLVHQKCWMRCLRLFCLFYKDLSNKISKYINDFILPTRHSFRHPNSFAAFPCRTEYLKKSFFLFVANDWNKFNPKICNSTSYLHFRNALINFFRPTKYKIFNINEQVAIELITRLRLGFSQLRKQKFRHNFEDTLNPLCSCLQCQT